VGAALVEAAGVAARMAGAGAMHLEVGEDNFAARGLYEKLGYQQAGRRRGYYAGESGSVDALLLRRALN
jgi:ribosomal-protein-alanine N-acetyltransferase